MEIAHVPNPGTQEVVSKTGESDDGKGILKFLLDFLGVEKDGVE
jgi:hypothetical protein